jgi:hypothetical protein
MSCKLPPLRTTYKPHKVFVWLVKIKIFGPDHQEGERAAEERTVLVEVE